MHWKLNTSNQGKFEEFKRLFNEHNCTLDATHVDLPEIVADPLTVIAHKASQMQEHVLVDDTSLEIENADVGINIRWLLEHLSNYIGRKAHWTVLLAYRQADKVYIFKGSIAGTIVTPSSFDGFGFDPVFLPKNAIKTLAEDKPNHYNARALAVDALLKKEIFSTKPTIENWEGPWQK